jgi:4-hydroxybenzoate polyprenyltransferase
MALEPAPGAASSGHRRAGVMARLDAYERLIRLDKPIGTLLLLWPTLTALWFASNGRPTWSLVVVFGMGTLLMRSAGCAFNDWADRRFDPHVERTASRPLATGEIGPNEALVVAAVLAFCAFLFVLTTNRTTILLSLPAIVVACVYPFSKRFLSLPQALLGVAFSFGIPMAYAAIHNHVPPLAWWMLLINLFWVVAYDTEYAMVDRDDDVKIGIRTSAITLGRFDVLAVMAFYALHLAAWAWLGRLLGLGGVYLLGIAAAAAQALWHYTLIRTRSRDGCFKAFRLNHWLGFAVFCGVAADLALR